ncbi:DUF397 domain-containing protein [Actinomadura sp. KC345]|uniref:DUF397 domain-containing protein n=1 Tax=Actinomadura sp. KC345 TaxID=2530371 RepID=UPI001044BD56|nr:DUF397 domain-containing protein [Actinomadura sp. KC345]TDC53172.1 DUF397 domain-containing protein [Actinomadura sp. KC345]
MSTSEDHPVWHKSSRSAQGADCVEVAGVTGYCAVRDSKDPEGPVLAFTRRDWSTLLDAIRTGAHDLP